MMKKILVRSILSVLMMMFLYSCSATPSKRSVSETKEKERVSESEDIMELERVEGEDRYDDPEDREEKSRKKKKEMSYFDGNRYVGPALKPFMDGLGKYFSEGCDMAVEIWKEALEKDQKRHEVAFNIGLCYERTGNVEESKKWYLKSYDINHNFLKPLYNLVLSMDGNLAEKKEDFLKIVEKTEDKVEKNNFIAWLYLQTNELDLAEKHAKKVLKIDEQNSDAVVSLATIYYRRDMPELADMALGTAEKWDRDNFRLQRLYGFLSYDMGNKGKATEHFQRAVKINPELPEVRNMLAVLAMEIEDYRTAKEHLEFALGINPAFFSAKVNLAIAYKGLEEYEKSRNILDELDKNKNIPDDIRVAVIFNLGILFLDADVYGDNSLERFDIAVEYFNRYLDLTKKSPDFRKKKAQIDEYIKEAENEKRRLELFIRTQERIQARQKAAEEEHKLFLKNKEAAFKKAVEEDSYEGWKEYLENFPVLGPDDKLSNAAKARFEEIKSKMPEVIEKDNESVPEEAEGEENKIKNSVVE